MGESNKSNSLDIIPIDIPTTPLDLISEEATDKIIKISWSPPQSDNGSPITGYKVYLIQGFNLKELAETSDLEYTFTVTEIGLTYEFKVSAINKVGGSPLTAPIQILAAIAPLAPSNFEVTEVSDKKISISWQESTYNGGAPILDYTLYYQIG